jgi:succinoglycan biosynthesis transport protein ExoP
MQAPEHLQTPRGLVRYSRPAELPVWGPPPQQPDFLDSLRKIWRHRYLLVCCTILLGAASIVTALSLPPRYIAEVRIQVGVPDIPILASDPRAEPGGSNNEKVENERIGILARGLIKQVVDRLQLQTNPEFNPALAKNGSFFRHIDLPPQLSPAADRILPWLRPGDPVPLGAQPNPTDDQLIDAVLAHLDASTLGRSQVLSVQASSRDPVVAAAIANTLADVYLASEKGLKAADSNRIEDYLAGRIAELRAQVEKSDRAVAEYRQKYGLYQGTNASVTSEQLTALNTQLIDAQTAKAEADSRLSEAMALKNRGLAGDSLPDVLNSPVIQQLRAQQAEAERNLAQLSATYGPKHPKIVDARAAMEDIRAKIEAEIGRIVDGLRHQAATAGARYAALQKNFDSAKTQAGGVSEQSIDLQALEREATVNSNLLEAMLNRAKETFGRAEVEQPDARLISPAAPPQRPSYPPKTLIVLLGTLAGVLLGVWAALMRESTDRTFRRADEVEQATGLPVMSMVPNLRGGTQPALQILRRPVSTYSEALRKIHIGLQLSVKGDLPKTILFSSSTPAEGKSVMAASFARLLARNGKRVLLVDCDWRSPTLHRLFHCSNRYGLVQLMFDEPGSPRAAIFNDTPSGLDVLVSGGWTPQSAEMLISDRMSTMLRTFASNYDMVILDGAPVLVSSEVLILSKLVDKTVFLIRWGHTHREAALDALRQLGDAEADVAGVVLSRVDAKRYREFSEARLNYDYGDVSVTRAA